MPDLRRPQADSQIRAPFALVKNTQSYRLSANRCSDAANAAREAERSDGRGREDPGPPHAQPPDQVQGLRARAGDDRYDPAQGSHGANVVQPSAGPPARQRKQSL